jgi:hypothetical protein
VPFGFVAMLLGGVLMGVARSVSRQEGSLLMCSGRSSVRLSRLEMALGSRLVGRLSALERLLGPPVCPRCRRRGGGHAVCQVGLSLMQFLSARTGQLAPGLRGVIV